MLEFILLSILVFDIILVAKIVKIGICYFSNEDAKDGMLDEILRLCLIISALGVISIVITGIFSNVFQ